MLSTNLLQGRRVSWRQVLVLLLAVTAALVVAVPAADAAEVSRVRGDDRVATSVAVARAGWDQASEVILATSRDYPDAVAAASLAAALDAPIVLTRPDVLTDDVAELLTDLQATRVTVLGGAGAVADPVVQAIQDLDVEARRIAGGNRFETAARIAQVSAENVRTVDTVAIALGTHATGRDAWPDALSAASLAGADNPVPTLLTATHTLPEVTLDAIESLGANRVVLLGGTTAVSESVAATLEGRDLDVDRLRGPDRYSTSVAVADAALEGDTNEPIVGDTAVFASGEDFADALSAGALAAHHSAPLLLVPGAILDDSVDAFVRAERTAFEDVLLVGGTAAVSNHVASELEAAVLGEPRPAPPPPPEPACPDNSSPDCAYTYGHPISTWERLAQCESGGNWAISTGNGYYGGVQFSLGSWQAVGGTGYPHQHSKWEQMHRAEMLQSRQGWAAWPSCTRKLGMR